MSVVWIALGILITLGAVSFIFDRYVLDPVEPEIKRERERIKREDKR